VIIKCISGNEGFSSLIRKPDAGVAEDVVKKILSFELSKERLITSWISGIQFKFICATDFHEFVNDVEDRFGFRSARLYALMGPDFRFVERIRITIENYDYFKDKKGTFSGRCKFYAIEDDSPIHSPGDCKHLVAVSSNKGLNNSEDGSNRSGQSEFRSSIIDRDGSSCVFCGNVDQIEAAHILPYASRSLLKDAVNRLRYGIGSVNDTSNGIALCWGCHKCFDANLICINPVDHSLMISDALLTNEREKFQSLQGKKIFPNFVQWPNTELLQYRVEMMNAATAARHLKKKANYFHCSLCHKDYRNLKFLSIHESKCHCISQTPAMYNTPVRDDNKYQAI
jgi:hypothetical protein